MNQVLLKSKDVNVLIKRLYKPSQKLGKEIFANEQIFDFSIIEGNVVAHFSPLEIDEIYKITIQLYRYSGEMYMASACDCSSGFTCEHVGALLYTLLDICKASAFHQLVNLKIHNELPPLDHKPKKIAKKASDQSKKTLAKKKKSLSIIGTKTQDYRILPLNNHQLYESLEFNKKYGYRDLNWDEGIYIELLPSDELLIKIVSNNEFRKVKPMEVMEVMVKMEGDQLLVKCLSCQQKLSTLCKHQYKLLQGATKTLEQSDYLTGKVTFQFFANKAFDTYSMNAEALAKHFHLKLHKNKIELIPKNTYVKSASWLNNTINIFENKKQAKKKEIKNIEQNLADGRHLKSAYLWQVGNDPDYSNPWLKFMLGYGFKTKEGIHKSDRKYEQFPKYFSTKQLALAKELFFQTMEPSVEKRFEQLSQIINANIDLLNEEYHYVYPDDITFVKPKHSELHLVKFSPHPIACKFRFSHEDGMIKMVYDMTIDGKPFNYNHVVFSNKIFCATRTTIHLFPIPDFDQFISIFGNDQTLLMPYTNAEEFSKFINGIKKNFEVTAEDDIGLKEAQVEKIIYQILLRELGEFIIFEPKIKVGEFSFNAFDADHYILKDKVYKVREEDRLYLIDFIKNVHPNFNKATQYQDYVFLPIKELMNRHWFLNFCEACDLAGIQLLGQKNLTKFKYSSYRAMTRSHVTSGIDWFEVDIGVSFGGEKIKTSDWIRAVRNNESFVVLKDGSLGVLPEDWLEQAKRILAIADVEKGNITISKYRYNVIEDLFNKIDDKKIIKELKAKKKRLAAIDTTKQYKLPKIIKATLRPYQKYGFSWLKFLDETGFGGILADDMGLGKTLQMISLLADQIKAAPSLVIVPRSLLFNWAAEIDKFCPKLKYTIHHGPSREKSMEGILPVNVIITTYDTAASDIEFLKTFEFNYIILDESQAIKNPSSKRYKAMRLLQSRNKIAMTGTPIENNTMDLFAQLSFTSPGLLGTQKSFRDDFAIPIDSQGSNEAAKLLRKLTQPFILRRTKEQVAKDLPEKTESIIYCEMGATQRKMYDNLKAKIKEDIESSIEEKGFNKSKFQMLDGLLRLRQMCNSPLLLHDSFTGENAASVKINILMQNLTEELDHHNALVFSQFTSLLSIVRDELDSRGIKYAYLDGRTRNRQAEVDKFMKQDDIQIFLISIKAGNTGLNLTKADYVYILDPWWNPAVEAQAIDRTHRIGQDKQIFAYKLICKNSIEEKILLLQAKKKKLASDIIRTDEGVMKSLDRESLMGLLE